MAGTDGVRIFLPDALDAPDGIEDLFRSTCCSPSSRRSVWPAAARRSRLAIDDNEVRDWFLIAEAAAVDDWIAHHAAGLVPPLRDGAPGGADSENRSVASRDDRVRAVETLCARVSRARSARAGSSTCRCSPPSAEALDVGAEDGTHGSRRVSRHAGRVVLGPRFRASPAVLPALPSTTRTRRMRNARRSAASPKCAAAPGIREAAEDEDDSGTGTWVIRPDEPQESVEDPFGLQRPTDPRRRHRS